MRRSTAVVLWTAYRTGPWVVRSLVAAGWRVVPLHPGDEGRGRSTACLRPRPCPSPAAEPDLFLEALEDVCRRERARAVVPLSEDAVRLLASREPAPAGAVVVGPTARQYAALCDKAALGAAAERVGVASPARAVVGSGATGGPWPELPSIVKPRSSEAVPSRLEAPAVVSTSAAREAALRRLLDAGLGAVVEELLTGPHWSVSCVRDGQGGFRAVVARILRTFPRPAGMPSLLQVAGPDEPASGAVRRLLESQGYRGPANVQLFERRGELLVHDVNLRVPATVAMSMAAGLDLPALGVEAALGGAVGTGAASGGAGLRYVSLVDELRARGPARDLAAAALSRRTVLDPPPSDPLWIPARVVAAGRSRARRVLRRGGTAR
jgi:predicted ATP-grasp superfamily ATP-dependent carboligase